MNPSVLHDDDIFIATGGSEWQTGQPLMCLVHGWTWKIQGPSTEYH